MTPVTKATIPMIEHLRAIEIFMGRSEDSDVAVNAESHMQALKAFILASDTSPGFNATILAELEETKRDRDMFRSVAVRNAQAALEIAGKLGALELDINDMTKTLIQKISGHQP